MAFGSQREQAVLLAASGAAKEADPNALNQFEYVGGQLRPSHPDLFARFAADSDHAVREGRPEVDVSYGPHPRQTFDLFRTPRRRRATIAYFHAGYWQSRDKSGFLFLAPALTADGFDVAMVNYPLSPDLNVGEIVTATHASIAAIAGLTGNAPLVLAGHSAGAQLAIELGMIARERDWPIAGILSISGVFDLAPLVGTSVNDKLGLNPESAKAASPLHRIVPGSPPATFVVGALETDAFRNQTDRMAQAWSEAGNRSDHVVVPGCDHFSILDALRSDGMLRGKFQELAGA